MRSIDVNTGVTEMLALFDNNFKTAIIKKKILQWTIRNILKAKKKVWAKKERDKEEPN